MEVLKRQCKQVIGHINPVRSFSRPVTRDDAENPNTLSAKPFSDIPGPKSLPLIGTLWNYLPVIGEYKFDRLDVNGLRKLRRYGPLVREDIVPGVPVVWVFTPEDIETVYRSEGRFPERRSHLALQKFRQDRPHIYRSGGLLPTNGESWWHIRSVFQRNLSRVHDVRHHLPNTDRVVSEFIQFAANTEKPSDFLPKLSRLYLELTCLVAFSTCLNSFSSEELYMDSLSSQLIEAAAITNSCILRTDNGPQLWKKWRTPLYRKLEKALHTLETAAIYLVNKVQNCQQNDSIVGQYLRMPELDVKDIYGMAVDILLAGIDTTTYTTCFILYHLGRDPTTQTMLHREACHLLADPSDSVCTSTLARAPLTRAVIKETLRLNPVSVGVGRILAKDAVLSGYRVPAGTVVVTQNQVTCRLEEYFPQPNKFMPERWVKGSSEYQLCSPYLVLPFGHGPRSCIARRLAEQAMQVFVLKIIREFEVKWHGGELGVRSLLINKPDQPVLISLQKRSH